MPDPIFIADISNWQRGIEPARIVAEGYTAVICKASEGTGFRDPQFDDWIPAIQAAGAIPGAYHFLRAGDGAGQARLLHQRLTDHGGPDGFLVACDNEKDATEATTRAFVDAWRDLSGDHPLIMYTGGWWWGPRGWNGAAMTPHLWHSHYVTGVDYGSTLYEQVPDTWWQPGYGGWDSATLLQFTSTANVAGQRVDVSAYRGSLDDLHALAAGTSSGAPTPQPGPAGPPWPGRYLRYEDGWSARQRVIGDDVAQWQTRMAERGWNVTVDGDYGPASRSLCTQFQREKCLDADGIVGPLTWDATWTAPIT